MKTTDGKWKKWKKRREDGKMTDEISLEKIAEYIESFEGKAQPKNTGSRETNKKDIEGFVIHYCPVLRRTTGGDGEIQINEKTGDVACELYICRSRTGRCHAKIDNKINIQSASCPYQYITKKNLKKIQVHECPTLRRRTGDGSIELIELTVACEYQSLKVYESKCHAKVNSSGREIKCPCPYRK